MPTCKVCSGSGSAHGHPDCPVPCLNCVDGIEGYVIAGSHYMGGDMVALAETLEGRLVWETEEEARDLLRDVMEEMEFMDAEVIHTSKWQHTQACARAVIHKALFGIVWD